MAMTENCNVFVNVLALVIWLPLVIRTSLLCFTSWSQLQSTTL